MRIVRYVLLLVVALSICAAAADKVSYSAAFAGTSAKTIPADPTQFPTPEEQAFLSERCGPFPAFYVELEGFGTMSHAGLSTIKQGHCVFAIPMAYEMAPVLIHREVPFQPNATIMIFYGGTAEMTVANGDHMFGTYDGYLEVQPEGGMIIHGVFVTTGGTGRFVGVTGTGDALGVQTIGPDGISASLTLKGVQTPVGKAKQ